MNRSDVDEFEKLIGQLLSTYDEMSLLSKKSPGDAVNVFKLKFINNSISKANSFLGVNYRAVDDFEVFDVDTLPQNSDVVFVLAQYIQAFEKFRADNVVQKHVTWFWAVKASKGEVGDEKGLVFIRTKAPKRLRD